MPQSAVEMALPCTIGDYTDFYTGIHHATTVGKLFRPDSPLLPNYKWVPIGYHGRASSIGVSGQSFARPLGQTKGEGDAAGVRPEQAARLRARTGRADRRRQRAGRADRHDASRRARCSASCCSTTGRRATCRPGSTSRSGRSCRRTSRRTISPWVVTMEALAPYRAAFERPAGDPQPLPYLDSETNRRAGAIDIDARDLAADRADARRRRARRAPDAVELSRRVLDAGAARRAPHRQRLQPAERRPARHRHAVGPRGRAGRLAARAVEGRQGAAALAERRDAHLPCRRRHADPARPSASARALPASALASAPVRCCLRGRDPSRIAPSHQQGGTTC